MFAAYQSKYLAHELTRRCPPDSVEKLAGALVDAQVDLNPHQVDAALFAFRSPLSKGALLADEVGLGKTIEAGLVISQKWAERKRRILVITPSNLRKQWHQELTEKFFLPCRILETRSYNAALKTAGPQPFLAPEVIICSYQFAKGKSDGVSRIIWDLVVIDEAHRLRNVYKPSNVVANTLKAALRNAPKLLLTATPLQNSLLELYGLVSFIDEHVFGDLRSFREHFTNLAADHVFGTLKARLGSVCHRTLRRQVLPYVRYTQRHSMVQPFTPDESEDHLYHLISEYLRRDQLQALPNSQRSLMTLVLRKLLASSTSAIAGALDTMSQRLRQKLRAKYSPVSPEAGLDADYEAFDATAEEWPTESPQAPVSAEDRAAIEQEISDLDSFRRLALSIEQNAKGRALLVGLERAFAEANKLGAARKAIIFTESRRTQDYLLRVLSTHDNFRDGIILFNGSNTDERSREIYREWLSRHEGTDRISGSRAADMRAALVESFRDNGQILIATEAGAEGINLQFCSLIVNYDLPWNPQRIEQRIGRCHRYGQQHDVVVMNFLNRKNEADQRVFQLLSEKFRLFEGVFGASDEVLGAIESGVDFEKRVAEIYQRCRQPQEIAAAFDQLQLELSFEINEAMTRTGQQLLENFDDEVREKLKIRDRASKIYLNRFERRLMQVTRQELASHADFLDDSSFRLNSCPFEGDIPLGLYELPRRAGNAHLFRLQHPLAQNILARAKDRGLPVAELRFDYEEHDGKVTVLEPFRGKGGWLALTLLTVKSLDQAEDHLIFSAATDDGQPLEPDAVARLLTLPGRDCSLPTEPREPPLLEALAADGERSIRREISLRNAAILEAEAQKLDGWADDLKLGLEREIKELDRQIKEARRVASAAPSLEEKLVGQKQIRELETQRNSKRRSLFEAQDRVDRQRNGLIQSIEEKMTQETTKSSIFTVRWSLT